VEAPPPVASVVVGPLTADVLIKHETQTSARTDAEDGSELFGRPVQTDDGVCVDPLRQRTLMHGPARPLSGCGREVPHGIVADSGMPYWQH
jgi:hypothetical protein